MKGPVNPKLSFFERVKIIYKHKKVIKTRARIRWATTNHMTKQVQKNSKNIMQKLLA